MTSLVKAWSSFWKVFLEGEGDDPGAQPPLLVVDDRAAVRGAVRHFIEAITHYKVCDAVDDGVSAIHKAMKACCDLVLLNLSMPLQDTLVTVSLLCSRLPLVKIVASALRRRTWETGYRPATGFDAVLTKQDGLSKLVATLVALMPEPHGCARGADRFTKAIRQFGKTPLASVGDR